MADKRYTNEENIFEWDKNKNRANQNKHEVSFEYATSAFDDKHNVTILSSDINTNEKRWLIISKIIDAFISVVYTMRSKIIRIITARPSSRKERKLYNKQNNL